MPPYSLDDLGWSSTLASALDALNDDVLNDDGLAPARVARAEREHYLLMTETADGNGLHRAALAGRLRHAAAGPGIR